MDRFEWRGTRQEAPPDLLVVETKIEDAYGIRNLSPLMRKGNLWFHTDGLMYVYYTPTHWRYLI